jgi:hypothetical protein
MSFCTTDTVSYGALGRSTGTRTFAGRAVSRFATGMARRLPSLRTDSVNLGIRISFWMLATVVLTRLIGVFPLFFIPPCSQGLAEKSDPNSSPRWMNCLCSAGSGFEKHDHVSNFDQ